jgi:hypothetical protein
MPNGEPTPSPPPESAEDYRHRRELEDRVRDDVKKSMVEEIERRNWRTKTLISAVGVAGVVLGVATLREIPRAAREAVKRKRSQGAPQ